MGSLKLPVNEPLVLHLVLTGYWFDEILAGEKNIEYRERSLYWKRLIWDRRHRITHVRFSRGYTKRTLMREVRSIDCGGCPYSGWDGQYYRIHLGDVVENTETGARHV